MKYSFALILATIVTLTSCVSNKIDDEMQQTGNQKPHVAQFEYLAEGLTVQFINTSSSELSEWEWNFGDGQTSADKSPIHTYLNGGTYSVKLTCFDAEDKRYTSTQTITLTVPQPTKAYIKGFKLYSIYAMLSSSYTKFGCVAHNKSGSVSINITTPYSDIALSEKDLPYTYLLPSTITIGDLPNAFAEYSDFVVSAYFAANTYANGVQALEETIPASKLNGIEEYVVEDKNNGTKVGLLIGYK